MHWELDVELSSPIVIDGYRCWHRNSSMSVFGVVQTKCTPSQKSKLLSRTPTNPPEELVLIVLKLWSTFCSLIWNRQKTIGQEWRDSLLPYRTKWCTSVMKKASRQSNSSNQALRQTPYSTKRITTDTPLTIEEVDKTNLKKQIKIKQKIKGKS